ncbi:Uncharacterized protein dnm_041620 [Desulfonema magnum]|uniref:Uncharacterized protein n=1 Tax=Desulfonema magnum TaxID=45655 RepID=A0A975GNT9_9BACT|nr:Uncharacterized protein dnm_041620 [Desulfonema magnum]
MNHAVYFHFFPPLRRYIIRVFSPPAVNCRTIFINPSGIKNQRPDFFSDKYQKIYGLVLIRIRTLFLKVMQELCQK